MPKGWWRCRPVRSDQKLEAPIEAIAHLAGVIDAIREAASSMAKGIPSVRRQISTTAAGFVVVGDRKAGRTCTVDEALQPRPIRCPCLRAGRHGPAVRRERRCLPAGGQNSHRCRECSKMAPTIRLSGREGARSCRTPAGCRPSSAAATLSVRVLPGCWGCRTRGHRVGDSRRIADRGQFEQPYTIGGTRSQRPATSTASRFTDPTDTGQRDQPMGVAQHGFHLAEFRLAR